MTVPQEFSLEEASEWTHRMVTKLVDPPEKAVAVIHAHWWRLAAPLFWTVVVLAGAVAVLIFKVPYAAYIAPSLVVLVALYFLYHLLRWYYQLLIVTSRRVVKVSGVILRRTDEIPFIHVNDVSSSQSLLGRVFGFGEIHIDSGSSVGEEVIPFVPKPLAVRRLLGEQGFGAPQPVSQGGDDSLSRLERLSFLYLNGLLTGVEYEKAKKVILDADEPTDP